MKSRVPTPEEKDAEENFPCIYCRVSAGEPCLYLFNPEKSKMKFLKEYRKRYGGGRWVHGMRLDERNLKRAKAKEQGKNA